MIQVRHQDGVYTVVLGKLGTTRLHLWLLFDKHTIKSMPLFLCLFPVFYLLCYYQTNTHTVRYLNCGIFQNIVLRSSNHLSIFSIIQFLIVGCRYLLIVLTKLNFYFILSLKISFQLSFYTWYNTSVQLIHGLQHDLQFQLSMLTCGYHWNSSAAKIYKFHTHKIICINVKDFVSWC